MSIFHEKNVINDVISTTQKEKEPEQRKKNKNVINSVPKKKDIGLMRKRSTEQAAWDERYFHENGMTYRLVPLTGGGYKPVFTVGDSDDAMKLHKEDEVEYGFTSAMLEEISPAFLAEKWKGKVADKPDGYIPTTEELGGIRQAYLMETLSPKERREYYESLHNNAETGATYQLIKKTGLWEIYHLLDLTNAYHTYQLHKDEYRQFELENRALRKEVKQKTILPSGSYGYERQEGANCYGCAGSKIVNHLAKTNLLNQFKVRSFKPRYLSREEFLAQGVDYDYDASKREVEEFAGYDKSRYGNFFAVSDVLFDKQKYGGLGRRDIAIHKCTFSLDVAKSPNAKANMIEAMKEKLHRVLKTGEPVSFFSKGHYVTIVGLSNKQITYLDSMSSKAEKPITKDFRKFLDEIGGYPGLSTTELTWATKITPASLKSLKDEYGGIGIDEKTGEAVRTNSVQEFDDVAHRVGIAIRKTQAKIEEGGNEDISHYMTESVCFHRGAFMTEKQFEQWEERDDVAWEAAQKEEQQKAKQPKKLQKEEEQPKEEQKEKEQPKEQQKEKEEPKEQEKKEEPKKQEKKEEKKEEPKELQILDLSAYRYPAKKKPDIKYEESLKKASEKAKEELKMRLSAGIPAFTRIFKKTSVSSELFKNYAEKYSDLEKYTQARREEEMKTPKTELFEKNRFALEMIKKSNRAKDRMAKARRKIRFDLKTGLSEERFKALSAFFSENDEENSLLVKSLSTEGDSFAFSAVTSRFLSINTENLDLTDDKALSAHAEKLEEISLKVQGIKKLLDTDRSFVKELRDQIISAPGEKNQETLYDRVMKQMDRLGRISDHYRIRKLVMTDGYYLSHYNKEIGLKVEKGKNRNLEHVTLSKLLAKSRDTLEKLEGLMTGKELEHWRTSGSSETIEALEEEHKTRAYADGRLDLTLVTKESMQSLLTEIRKFKSEHPNTLLTAAGIDTVALTKGYSDRFKKLIRQIQSKGNLDAMKKTFFDEMLPGAFDKLVDLAAPKGEESRLNKTDDKIPFKNPFTGESFSYGSSLTRDYGYFIQAGASQMMSEEEILELFEDFCVANWKDVDYSDPEQAAAAQDLYLRSYAKIYAAFANEEKRNVRTYGLIPTQLPPIALTVASNGNTLISHRLLIANAMLDMPKTDVVTRDGKKIPILEYLVQKGYLSREFVADREQTTDLTGGINMVMGNMTSHYDLFFGFDQGPLEYQFESVVSTEFADQNNTHRGEKNTPELSEKEERKIWTLCNEAAAHAGMAEQGKLQHESYLRAINAKKQHTRHMAKLNRFIDNLADMDTSGHSNAYKVFHRNLLALFDCHSTIIKKSPADGKNLDPESMIDLRRAYEKTIRTAKQYLRPKNRSHRNAIYRRRYDIVEELIQTLEVDYKFLGEKSPDKSWSLEEALEESRAMVVDISKEKLAEVGGALNKRKVIPEDIDGKKRYWVFTDENAVTDKNRKKLYGTERKHVLMYEKYGIPQGANLNKRNVAMSIMAKELDTEKNIAKSVIARIELTKGMNSDYRKGTMMEYINGIKIRNLKEGILNGEFIVDNESSIIEQLSDIQVTDYLCGNVDRHMGNMMFEMEETGKVNKTTKVPIRRIKRIVGVDHDLSFGTMLAKNLKRHTKKMSIPETMQLISRKTADRVLALQKEPLFLMLGSTVTEAEKEAMWTRVENLQIALMNASSKTTQKGLSIVDSFREYTVRDLAGANLEGGNIYRLFCVETDQLGQKGKLPDKEAVPHRLNAKEVRLDITASKIYEDEEGDEWATLDAIQLYHEEMQKSEKSLRNMTRDPKKLLRFRDKLLNASQEFDRNVGTLFDYQSTIKNYGGAKALQERADLFSNDYAREHGVNSILDLFFIDGKPAAEALPQIDRIMTVFEPEMTSEETRLAYRDMVAKACIMGCLVSGTKQITIANYQKDKNRQDEFVITDLDVYIHEEYPRELISTTLAGSKDSVKRIEKNRKTREERFKQIWGIIRIRENEALAKKNAM
jgi:hypothetical protein